MIFFDMGLGNALTEEEQEAWNMYCEETAGSMHVVDFWEELSEPTQKLYLHKVKHAKQA